MITSHRLEQGQLLEFMKKKSIVKALISMGGRKKIKLFFYEKIILIFPDHWYNKDSKVIYKFNS
jgi:hypothetical protein